MDMFKIRAAEDKEHIFRPWNREKDIMGQSVTNNGVLNLSRENSREKATSPLTKRLSPDTNVPIPLAPVIERTNGDERNMDSVRPTTEVAPVWTAAFLQQLQFQAYLQNLHFQLLSMSKVPVGSGSIYRVHQQALLDARAQHANEQMAKIHEIPKPDFHTDCPAPSRPFISAPHSSQSPCQSLDRSLSHNNFNSYPLPSAKDGEPLDLLPKSLYLNKSQGGHLCIFCGKVYSRKYGLKIHLRTHTGYKPLKCKVCARPFGDPSNLNKHIRLHAEGDTPYRCEYCGKVLVRRRDLERHIRSRHPQEVRDFSSEMDMESWDENDMVHSTSSDSGMQQELNKTEELDVVG